MGPACHARPQSSCQSVDGISRHVFFEEVGGRRNVPAQAGLARSLPWTRGKRCSSSEAKRSKSCSLRIGKLRALPSDSFLLSLWAGAVFLQHPAGEHTFPPSPSWARDHLELTSHFGFGITSYLAKRRTSGYPCPSFPRPSRPTAFSTRQQPLGRRERDRVFRLIPGLRQRLAGMGPRSLALQCPQILSQRTPETSICVAVRPPLLLGRRFCGESRPTRRNAIFSGQVALGNTVHGLGCGASAYPGPMQQSVTELANRRCLSRWRSGNRRTKKKTVNHHQPQAFPTTRGACRSVIPRPHQIQCAGTPAINILPIATGRNGEFRRHHSQFRDARTDRFVQGIRTLAKCRERNTTDRFLSSGGVRKDHAHLLGPPFFRCS